MSYSVLQKYASTIFFFKMNLNSRNWMSLKSSVVIFQSVETSVASLTWVAYVTLLASTASKPNFLNKLPTPSAWVISGTKLTNTCPLSSKIQFFTDIWYSFCRRLVRPVNVTFSKTGWYNLNVKTSGSSRHHNSLKILILLLFSFVHDTPCR